jgi:hypothetical protein
VPVQLVVGAADVETWEITHREGGKHWMPGANDAGKTRPERLDTLRRSFEAAGVKVTFDLLDNVPHNGRLAMAVPTLFIVSVTVFALIRLVPGDPASLMLGDLATPAALADLRTASAWTEPAGAVPHLARPAAAGRPRAVHHLAATGAAAGLDRFVVSARIVVIAVLWPHWSRCRPACSPPGARTAWPTWRWSARPRCCCRSRPSGWAC